MSDNDANSWRLLGMQNERSIRIFKAEIDKMILLACKSPELPESQEVLKAFKMLDRLAHLDGIDVYEVAARLSARVAAENRAREWAENRQSTCVSTK